MPPSTPRAGCGAARTPDPVGAKMFGARVARLEDPALLTGRGTYTDDIHLPDALEWLDGIEDDGSTWVHQWRVRSALRAQA